MLLQLHTWVEVEEYLKSRDDIIVPIGYRALDRRAVGSLSCEAGEGGPAR